MNPDITIDLFNSNLPGSIHNDEFVQKTLRKQLINQIKECVGVEQSLGQPKKGISESGRQVFFIDGTRGAGKTTFLNGIVDGFSPESTDSGDASLEKGSIFPLRCIDPTKLPGVEPVLVTVIAQLNATITKTLRCCGRWEKDTEEKRNWEQCLKKISKAMKLLHSKDYSSEYFDDALDLHGQLQYSADGLGLAEQFDQLLKHACDILKCRAILIAFDDIDTQFNTGWNVLESIRKYFNSPSD
ncbi:hypothetical protein [Endozoicomonas ascidiicola]|uniref:hypothetical protein n=1 Tax=Endozoicomonas ascidiicola TaxID=1698521 RepID=UPI0008377C09|nr:hypothetical protein [Endozoicomonas ascidiicola]